MSDFNEWYQDYTWDQYKDARQLARWDSYASAIGDVGGLLAGWGSASYYGTSFDYSSIGTTAADVMRGIAKGEYGVPGYVPPEYRTQLGTASTSISSTSGLLVLGLGALLAYLIFRGK